MHKLIPDDSQQEIGNIIERMRKVAAEREATQVIQLALLNTLLIKKKVELV